ncbi:MAG: RelA/SpoT family protein [Desulfohalobiaceae bacterium]
MIRINEIIDKVSPYLGAPDQALIQKAYVYAAAAHSGQVRLSGEPYLSHPLEVANILAEMRLDAATIAAGLLHDTVEDTDIEISEVREQFNEEVALIVDGVTKIGKMSFTSRQEAQAENIRKMMLAMSEDFRVIMVKLADRLHNMRTLGFQKSVKQRLVAQETLDIYAPLANRFGLYRLKVQLEDLSLKYLKPDLYNQIETGIKKHQTLGLEYIAHVTEMIDEILVKNAIKGRVAGRQKHIYSIYNKMQQQSLNLDQIYDLIAFRVLVDTVKDCYAVLGLVHSIWKPVPGRFKDYISMPKANMYQSLHTTVIGPRGERIEIQIRTEEMHQINEYGVAAHWKYKEGSRFKAKDEERFQWLRQIMDWQQEIEDPREFMSSLRFDLFQEEVYVFTPRGEVKELPDGATPVDFAYLIHTEVGSHCSGAKVNGRLVPLDTRLKNGDTVEIITNPARTPSRDWLKFVKTAKARTRIKHWIRTEERARSIALAREMLEKEGRKLGINVAKAMKEHKFDALARDFSFRSVDDLLSAVGYARITPQKVLRRLLPKAEKEKQEDKEPTAEERAEAKGEAAKTQSPESVVIKGVDDVLLRFAKCCNPLPGDPIVGYISHGRGVTVHTTDCPNLESMEPERFLDVSWAGQETEALPAKIRITARNAPGVLGEIASLLAREGVNIDAGNFQSTVDGLTEIHFTVAVNNASLLYRALEKLNSLGPVLEATRSTGPGN